MILNPQDDTVSKEAETFRGKRATILILVSVLVVCAVVATTSSAGLTSLAERKKNLAEKKNGDVKDLSVNVPSSPRLTPLQHAEMQSGLRLTLADLNGDFGSRLKVSSDGNTYGPFGIQSPFSKSYLNVAGPGAGAVVNTKPSLVDSAKFYFENVGPWGIKNALVGNYVGMKANGGGLTTRSSIDTESRFLIFKQRWMDKDPTKDDSSNTYLLYGEFTHQFLAISGTTASYSTRPSSGSGYLSLIATSAPPTWKAVASCRESNTGLTFLNGYTRAKLTQEAQSRTFGIRFASSDPTLLDVTTKSGSTKYFMNLKNGEPVSGTAGPGATSVIDANWKGVGLSHLWGGTDNYAVNGGQGTNLYFTNGNGHGLYFTDSFCYLTWRSTPPSPRTITMYISE